MTRGTFTGHGAPSSFGYPEGLVKNADGIRPSAVRPRPEVTAVRPSGNRDDYRESPAE